MGLLGVILSTAVNIVNVPAKLADKLIGEEDAFSYPLKELSKIVKKVDE